MALRADLIPNALTISRFPLALCVWPLRESPMAILGLMALAGLTDVLDGWFARRLRRSYLERGLPPPDIAHSKAIGAWLDPVADKTFVFFVLATVWFHYQPPLWQALTLFTRELIQAPLVLFYVSSESLKKRLDYDFTASLIGKATTVAQFVALTAVLFESRFAGGLCAAAGVLGIFAAASYVRRGMHTKKVD